eukprot:1138101-Pelagomonas_calceolata.AAC.2
MHHTMAPRRRKEPEKRRLWLSVASLALFVTRPSVTPWGEARALISIGVRLDPLSPPSSNSLLAN